MTTKYSLTLDPILDYVQDVYLMALVVWREARNEPREGKIAVAYTIMNRVKYTKWWGETCAEVIFKKWQYSSMTDPNDPQLKLLPQPYEPVGWRSWAECLGIARDVYEESIINPAPGADSYFADYIPTPKWADPKKFVVKIGHHSFYDLDSDYEKEKVS
jgi:spore germination cell wall hydrolase CwlJ-like protein